MRKKGVSGFIAVVLIISLILALAVLIINVVMPLIQKAISELDNNPLNKELNAQGVNSLSGGVKSCSSNWQCGQWSKCEISYSLENLMGNTVVLEGKRRRPCEDSSHCAYNKIEDDKCDTFVPVSVQKVTKCPKEYVEVREAGGALVSRIDFGSFGGFNIQFFLGDVGYCPSCYDGVKNYDEEGIDCVYSGDSCPLCK